MIIRFHLHPCELRAAFYPTTLASWSEYIVERHNSQTFDWILQYYSLWNVLNDSCQLRTRFLAILGNTIHCTVQNQHKHEDDWDIHDHYDCISLRRLIENIVTKLAWQRLKFTTNTKSRQISLTTRRDRLRLFCYLQYRSSRLSLQVQLASEQCQFDIH